MIKIFSGLPSQTFLVWFRAFPMRETGWIFKELSGKSSSLTLLKHSEYKRVQWLKLFSEIGEKRSKPLKVGLPLPQFCGSSSQ